jgi:hypothetical protein
MNTTKRTVAALTLAAALCGLTACGTDGNNTPTATKPTAPATAPASTSASPSKAPVPQGTHVGDTGQDSIDETFGGVGLSEAAKREAAAIGSRLVLNENYVRGEDPSGKAVNALDVIGGINAERSVIGALTKNDDVASSVMGPRVGKTPGYKPANPYISATKGTPGVKVSVTKVTSDGLPAAKAVVDTDVTYYYVKTGNTQVKAASLARTYTLVLFPATDKKSTDRWIVHGLAAKPGVAGPEFDYSGTKK